MEDINELVDSWRMIRDARLELDKQSKIMSEKEDEIKGAIIGWLSSNGIKGTSADKWSVSYNTISKASIANLEKFLRWQKASLDMTEVEGRPFSEKFYLNRAVNNDAVTRYVRERLGVADDVDIGPHSDYAEKVNKISGEIGVAFYHRPSLRYTSK